MPFLKGSHCYQIVEPCFLNKGTRIQSDHSVTQTRNEGSRAGPIADDGRVSALQKDIESGLFKMVVRSKRIGKTHLTHDDKAGTISEAPFLIESF